MEAQHIKRGSEEPLAQSSRSERHPTFKLTTGALLGALLVMVKVPEVEPELRG